MTIDSPVLLEHLKDRARAKFSAADTPLFVNGLTVAYDRRPVLWDINYESPHAGLVAIVGPNGAGKSTFLKAVTGLVPRLAGHVRIFGDESRRAVRRVAYVPQCSSIDWDFPASALDVVTMGLYGRIGWFRPVRRRHRAEALACLDQVGLADFANCQIGQLSGGQRQRVFIARALAQTADLYLMDEPLAGIDALTEARIIAILEELRASGRTVLVVHHDLSTVHDYFSHVLVLNGRIVASGTTAEAFNETALAAAYGNGLAIRMRATAGAD